MKISAAVLSHAVAIVRGELRGDVAQAELVLEAIDVDAAKVRALTAEQVAAFLDDYSEPIPNARLGAVRVLGIRGWPEQTTHED